MTSFKAFIDPPRGSRNPAGVPQNAARSSCPDRLVPNHATSANSGETETRMTLRRTLVAAALAALTIAPTVGASSAALTKDQAFARASKCLKAHGARDVLARGLNLGGLAQYGGTTRGTAMFKYEVRGDLAVGVELQFTTSSSGGPTKVERRWAQRCVTWGVPLVR